VSRVRSPAGPASSRGRVAAVLALAWLGVAPTPPLLAETASIGSPAAPLPATPARGSTSGDTVTIAPSPSGSLFRESDVAYGVVVFGSALLIEPLEGFERSVRSHTPGTPTGFDKAFVDAGTVAGHPFVNLGMALAAWGGGKLIGSRPVERAGLDGLETLIAADAVLEGGKVLLGRQRPYVSSDPDRFEPLNFHEANQSFPSGHAARAFALAAVAVGDFPDQKWMPWVAYPAATAVAVSRVVGRDHWVTDVVSGAALGLLSTRVILRLNGRVAEHRREAADGDGGSVGREDSSRDASFPGRRTPVLAVWPIAGGAIATIDFPLP